MTFLDVILALSGVIALIMIIAGARKLHTADEDRLKWLLFIAVGVMTLLNLLLFWLDPVYAL